MSLSKDRVGGLLLLLFFTSYGLVGLGIELPAVQQSAMFNARSVPTALTFIGLSGGLWLVLKPRDPAPANFVGLRWIHAAAFLALMSAYGLAIRPLGFVLSTLLFLAIGFVVLGERRPIPIIATAASVTGGFWLLMHYGLGVYLAPWPSVWGN